jgi:Gram-negative bacterial TonB protein C-terminal
MGRLLKIVLCTSIALGSVGAAVEPPAVPKARVGAWEINYDVDSCNLLAEFGDGPQRTIVRLTRYQPEDAFDLAIYGEGYKYPTTTVPVRIGFGLGAPVKRDAMTGQAGNALPLLIVNSLRLDGWESRKPGDVAPPITPEQEARASLVDLTVPKGKRLRLEGGSFAQPMAAMRACTDDLVKSWGYDPAQQASLSAKAEPTRNPGTWLNNGDYPSGALIAGHNGIVQFRLDIDEAGKVTGCRVLHRTNPDSFSTLTCKRIGQRARFRPARDKDGKPVRSYYVNKARFVIPE